MEIQRNRELTIAEAKENFAAAMDQIAPLTLIREFPLKSMGVAAAAGAAAYFSGRRSLKSLTSLIDAGEFLLRKILTSK